MRLNDSEAYLGSKISSSEVNKLKPLEGKVIELVPSKNLMALAPHFDIPSNGVHTVLIVSGIF